MGTAVRFGEKLHAQRSALMAKVRSSGNASTELRLIAVFRVLRITGWRRGVVVRVAAPRSTKAPRTSATSAKASPTVAERGTRFVPAPKAFRVCPDFVFPKLRLAVFVDGCFWHRCPLHATRPKQNAKFWSAKIAANQTRDRLVTRTLRARGWRVLRVWEHELTQKHATRLATRLRRAGLPHPPEIPSPWQWPASASDPGTGDDGHTARQATNPGKSGCEPTPFDHCFQV